MRCSVQWNENHPNPAVCASHVVENRRSSPVLSLVHPSVKLRSREKRKSIGAFRVGVKIFHVRSNELVWLQTTHSLQNHFSPLRKVRPEVPLLSVVCSLTSYFGSLVGWENCTPRCVHSRSKLLARNISLPVVGSSEENSTVRVSVCVCPVERKRSKGKGRFEEENLGLISSWLFSWGASLVIKVERLYYLSTVIVGTICKRYDFLLRLGYIILGKTGENGKPPWEGPEVGNEAAGRRGKMEEFSGFFQQIKFDSR